jgi:hypothetical protein
MAEAEAGAGAKAAINSLEPVDSVDMMMRDAMKVMGDEVVIMVMISIPGLLMATDPATTDAIRIIEATSIIVTTAMGTGVIGIEMMRRIAMFMRRNAANAKARTRMIEERRRRVEKKECTVKAVDVV